MSERPAQVEWGTNKRLGSGDLRRDTWVDDNSRAAEKRQPARFYVNKWNRRNIWPPSVRPLETFSIDGQHLRLMNVSLRYGEYKYRYMQRNTPVESAHPTTLQVQHCSQGMWSLFSFTMTQWTLSALVAQLSADCSQGTSSEDEMTRWLGEGTSN